MINKLVLALEELYFLGKLMKGNHIDYAYIAAMRDVQQHKALYDQTCRDHLASIGAVEEDFWGELAVNETIKALLSPIFFGTFESEIILLSHQSGCENYDIRFHWLNHECRMTVINDGNIEIHTVTPEELAGIVLQLMPQDYNTRQAPDSEQIILGKKERTIILKNITWGETAAIYAYYVRSGWMCEQNYDEGWSILSPKQFYDKAMQILKGKC